MGAFDGLHRGHRSLIERARSHGERVALVTFDPHPTAVLAPERMPPLLHAPVQRERVAAALDVSHLVLLPFDLEMSRMAPEAFLRQFFTDGLQPAAVVVGADFRFGARRAGTAHGMAAQLGPEGTHVDVVDLLSVETGKKVKQARLSGARQTGGRFGSLDYPSPVVVGDRMFYLNGSGQMYVFALGEKTSASTGRCVFRKRR